MYRFAAKVCTETETTKFGYPTEIVLSSLTSFLLCACVRGIVLILRKSEAERIERKCSDAISGSHVMTLGRGWVGIVGSDLGKH
jgi:hypothetical protein